ncbi:MAG: aldo/keto reductase [Betaproteobacteria bacterium]|nr:MAG: aldo/keto reductase [Betaproteobacteria bacterium]
MQQRNLGRSGLQVSLVGLGCNTFGAGLDLAASRSIVHKALDLGITFFDTSDNYGNLGGSETCLGASLGERRKDVVVATKFASPMDKAGALRGGSRRYVMRAVEASLRRLNTDWIDLYQMHRPDPLTPIEETLRALDDLVHQGKVRYIGCSNFAAWQAVEAHWTARYHGLTRFVSCQDQYSLVARDIERDLIPAMAACGLGLLPYAPLSSGILTGKYRRGEPMPAGSRLAGRPDLSARYATDARLAAVERLRAFCAERGHSLLELAMSWLAAQPVMGSIIAGATGVSQLEANAGAVNWTLSQDDLAEVDRLSRLT